MIENIDKIYVCHYTKLKERKPILEKQLQKYDIDAEWVTKYDKEDILNSDLDTLVNIRKPFYTPGHSRTLRMSEISLLLKHNYIWEDMKSNSYNNVLVLEDDALLSGDFDIKFNEQFDNNLLFDIIWVGTCCDIYSENITKGDYLYKEDGSRCTHGYIINKRCIDKIVESFKYNNYPADFLFNILIKTFELENYWMEPPIVFQNDIFKSAIQSDNDFI